MHPHLTLPPGFSRHRLCAVLIAVGLCSPAQAQFVQQGPKLVGTGGIETSGQGFAVALSADGNTAIVGGPGDYMQGAPPGKNEDPPGATWIYTRSGSSWSQQGPKLVGSSLSKTVSQGFSVSLSADGNTALISGSEAGLSAGAIWFFQRSGGVWTQQSPKIALPFIIPSPWITAMGPPSAVALSGDGYTAVAGARGLGTRVFARSGSVWTQQAVLVGSDMTGSTGDVTFGCGYSISADGNTIAVGGEWDNGGAGAAWIFTRSNGQWSQQGPKLVGSGAIGPAAQGLKVALSADGNSLLSTGITDNGGIGAVWFFTRSGGVWKQQGAKIVPTDLPSFPTYFGEGVALSGDGNTAFFAGYSASGTTRNSYLWVFRRTYGGWSQNGPYFYGTGGTATSLQCCGTAMSADGNTLIAGASQDNAPDPSGWGVGAAWIFARQSLRVTAPASAVAGVPVSIGVLAVEPNNVMSTGYDGSVNLTSTDPKALLPQNANLANSAGTFSATFNTPGPQTVSANFTASPLVAGTSNAISVRVPDIQISPSSLSLQYNQGSDPSSTLPGSLIVSAEAPIPFTAVAASSWLIVSPASGTTPATVTVRPSPTGLPQGSYNTNVNLTFADGRTLSVPVSLSVAAPVVAVTFANGASFAAGPAAPNTLLAAFGSFPRCTSGAQVLIDGSSTIVFASSPTQINFLVPPAVAGKQIAMVQIACAGLTYQPVTMQIAAATPAIFTASQDGAGQAAIVNQDGSLNTPSPRGTVVTLYGTGFGLMVHGSPDGLAHTVLPVTAYLGGAAATVLYAGEAPGYTSGLQQINVLIPLDSPAGASVPLQLVVGGFDTQVGLTLALQ